MEASGLVCSRRKALWGTARRRPTDGGGSVSRGKNRCWCGGASVCLAASRSVVLSSGLVSWLLSSERQHCSGAGRSPQREAGRAGGLGHPPSSCSGHASRPNPPRDTKRCPTPSPAPSSSSGRSHEATAPLAGAGSRHSRGGCPELPPRCGSPAPLAVCRRRGHPARPAAGSYEGAARQRSEPGAAMQRQG